MMYCTPQFKWKRCLHFSIMMTSASRGSAQKAQRLGGMGGCGKAREWGLYLTPLGPDNTLNSLSPLSSHLMASAKKFKPSGCTLWSVKHVRDTNGEFVQLLTAGDFTVVRHENLPAGDLSVIPEDVSDEPKLYVCYKKNLSIPIDSVGEMSPVTKNVMARELIFFLYENVGSKIDGHAVQSADISDAIEMWYKGVEVNDPMLLSHLEDTCTLAMELLRSDEDPSIAFKEEGTIIMNTYAAFKPVNNFVDGEEIDGDGEEEEAEEQE